MAGSNISTKNFRPQPAYEGGRINSIIVCNAHFSKYGSVEEVIPVRATEWMAHGDYVLNICLDIEGFQAILHIIAYEDKQMMVVVEGRRSTLLVL